VIFDVPITSTLPRQTSSGFGRHLRVDVSGVSVKEVLAAEINSRCPNQ